MALLWLLSFVLAAATDMLYVLWMRSVSADSKIRAVVFSMAIGTASLIGFLNTVDERQLVIPYIIGLGAGTYFGMIIDRKRT